MGWEGGVIYGEFKFFFFFFLELFFTLSVTRVYWEGCMALLGIS